ncbi:MAG TPA: hypothetical protein VE172_05745 [Stackebrandtia sp.]|jgi:hypothetical protein|uniref:hypothetical protein n=1 Tax=Stackebrandtia sp. TaxID=2023065 RepID=UPI002D5A1F6F|nr:hypothetical protein [Stackebrandtia sp.]HZE38297.1 hypothetical protein [Stackebrandtia sp.]
MSEFETRYHRMTVTATSPDGEITGTMNNQLRLSVTFVHEDAFYDYDGEALAHQLGALLRGLDAGRQRGVRAIYTQAGMTVSDSDSPHWDANERRYHAGLRELASLGHSATGAIEIAAFGTLTGHQVTIDSHHLGDMELREFLSQLHDAYRNLIQDFREQQQQLLERYLPD